MNSNNDLVIVIVSWNTREMLANCLNSIMDTGCRIPDAGASEAAPTVEVIVVDNASRDGSVEMVREGFPWVRLIENDENVGFARANNQAIRESQGRYVALLNSDTELTPYALEILISYMDSLPDVGAVGPYLLNGDGETLQSSCHPVLTPWREFWRLLFLDRLLPQATYPMHQWSAVVPREVEVIKGACLILRREALDQVGLLDERYFMYSEEMDLCHRLLEAGWRLVWVPQARVVHYGEGSSKQVAETMYVQLYRSKVQFHRKFGDEARALWFKGLLALAFLSRWFVTAFTRHISPKHRSLHTTYRHLLRELPKM